MSAQQLADRCSELGHPIARSVLANFESGRRPTISVPELLVLAKALGVPPIAFLFPVGRTDEVELLPDRRVPTWRGLHWFTGEDPLPVEMPEGSRHRWAVGREDSQEWQDDLAGLTDFRWHDTYVKRWKEKQRQAAEARTDAARDALLEEASHEEAPLFESRRRLRSLGVLLPELPEGLDHIDADNYQPDWGWTRA